MTMPEFFSPCVLVKHLALGPLAGFYLENFLGGGGGGGERGGRGNWRNLDFRGASKFRNCLLGDRGMLECVCVFRVSYRMR